MQVKETLQSKPRGRAGFTDKRFWLRDTVVAKVNDYKRKMSARAGKDVKWEDALTELINTHPKMKSL